MAFWMAPLCRLREARSPSGRALVGSLNFDTNLDDVFLIYLKNIILFCCCCSFLFFFSLFVRIIEANLP